MSKPADLTNAELNTAIAREVMGWRRMLCEGVEDSWVPDGRLVSEWSPTTDITAAFEVVEEMRKIDHTTFVVIKSPNHRNPRGWSCQLWMRHRPNGINEPTAMARADILPRAICEAALAAVRSEG